MLKAFRIKQVDRYLVIESFEEMLRIFNFVITLQKGIRVWGYYENESNTEFTIVMTMKEKTWMDLYESLNRFNYRVRPLDPSSTMHRATYRYK